MTPLPDSDLDDIMALVDAVPDDDPACVSLSLDDVRALVAECRAHRAKVAQPTTPAPAWESCDGGYGMTLGRYCIEVYQRGDGTWRGSVTSGGTVSLYHSPHLPTAPLAARAAVAALRAIVGPVADALDRVPDLDE